MKKKTLIFAYFLYLCVAGVYFYQFAAYGFDIRPSWFAMVDGRAMAAIETIPMLNCGTIICLVAYAIALFYPWKKVAK